MSIDIVDSCKDLLDLLLGTPIAPTHPTNSQPRPSRSHKQLEDHMLRATTASLHPPRSGGDPSMSKMVGQNARAGILISNLSYTLAAFCFFSIPYQLQPAIALIKGKMVFWTVE